MLSISMKGHDKVGKSILITGAARSGTTIVGKIIHSFKDVEYTFEPPVLLSLFSLIHTMPEGQWKLLYETYLYEEHFINALSGRSINCNRQDDSSIYQVKDNAEIEARLRKLIRKEQAENTNSAAVIAYKMPDIVSRVPRLLEYYPQTRVVVVNRGYVEILNSLYQKKWFEPENANKNLLWPFTVYKDIQIPFWVREEDHDVWYNMKALDRCAYYYLEIVRNINNIPNRVDVFYSDLIAAPAATSRDLSDELNLSFGSKTMEVLASIRPTNSIKNRGILDGVSDQLRTEILALEEKNSQCFA